MNKTLPAIFVSFLVGVGVGATVSSLLLKKKIKDDADNKREKEVSELKSYYDDLYSIRLDELNKSLGIKVVEDEKQTTDIPEEKESTTPTTTSKSKKKTDYTSFNPYTLDPGGPTEGDLYELEDGENVDILTISDSVNRFRKEAYKRGIEIIDEETYLTLDVGFEKKDCFYYIASGILVDEMDEVFDGYLDYVGSEWIDDLEEHPGTIAYVRNNRMGIDYMITSVEGEYIYE